jgi:S-methylmethionine-dependent homocysteine/selenocysteine methylase|tara:strand:+ start:555 stop:1472 length:918 start_codon:yes stop_codon:yes gene_type:complete
MSRYNRMMERANNEHVILMDGATGTEVERRGVAQLNNAWNGGAALSDPDILRTVHEDYIQNGAEIIISNTFATAKHALIDAGRETDFEKLNSRAVQIAVEARKKTNADHVCVAGGISYWTWTGKKPSLADLKATVTRQAQIMAESGADLLMLEMMIDIEQMMVTYHAAKSSGLPTWIGLTCGADDKGEICLRDGDPLAQAVASLSNDKPDVINIMHTDVSHVAPALNYLKSAWKKHVGVYAHSGKTINGKWTFNDVLSPAEYQQHAESWIDKGVTFIGGCCGISVKHIASLNKTLKKTLYKNENR